MKAEPTTVQAGSRRVVVQNTPLMGAESASFRCNKIRQPRPDLLVLSLNATARLMYLIVSSSIIAAFSFVALCISFSFPSSWRWLVQCALCIPLAYVVFRIIELIYRGERRYLFDLASSQMIVRCIGRKQVRPIADILAVQLVYGGQHGDELTYRTYQLNLVLDDLAQPRFNLTNHSDLLWTRQAAAKLAEFLGVRLLDRVPNG